MLTPVPAIFDQSADSLSLQSFTIPPPAAATTAPSSSSSSSWPTHSPQPHDPHQHLLSHTYTTRATRRPAQARSSKLLKSTHHHRNRPSRQFVATTSNTIFGDWDLDIKIEHRRKGRNANVAAAVATTGAGAGGGAGRSGGARGGGVGTGRGGFALGPGPGIHTGSLGTQPLSTFPSSSPSIAAPTSIPGRHQTSSSIPSTQAHSAALNILKGQRSNQSFQNNKMATLPKGSGITSATLSSNGQQKHKNTQRNVDNNNSAVPANKTTITTAASLSSPAHKPPAAQKHLQPIRHQQQPLEQKQQPQVQQPTSPQQQQKQQQQQQSSLTVESNGTTAASGSAKSGFLRALGKFKSKHMQQKRSSAPPPAHESIDLMASADQDNRRASYILPPIQFGESDAPATTTTTATTTTILADKPSSPLRQYYEQQQLQAKPASISPPSLADSSRMTDYLSMDTSDTPVSSVQGDVTERVSNPSSSLRVKFKNRVSNTLASMKSSSNLRDRAKADHQAAAATTAAATGEGDSTGPSRRFLLGDRRLSAQASLPSQDQQSQEVNATTPQNTVKKRNSRNFWTFPRVRLDTTPTIVTSKQGWEESATVSPTAGADALDEDVTMMSPDAGPGENSGLYGHNAFARLHHEQQPQEQQQQQRQQQEGRKPEEEEGEDSDHSIDIIQPADYQDYTQFAEFPLKKRKKMERSLAASLAAETSSQSSKRPNSVRASADAMRRFLLLQQQQQKDGAHSLEAGADSSNIASNNNNKKKKNKKNKGQAAENTLEVIISRDMGPPAPVMNKANKRPQLSTSSLDSTDQIPKRQTTTATQGGGGASDWRRSFLKSLHLGRALPKKKGGPLIVQEHQQPSTSTSQVVTVTTEDGRVSRSGSVRSTRSRSLVTATHPALLATTMVPKPRGVGSRRETLEMAMRRRRQSSAARSRIGDTEIPPPLPSEFFGMGDNSSTMNITHTFTSFTLELADMHARDVINNSATPGLFNWKFGPPASIHMHRRPTQSSMSRRITVSSNVMDVDTDQEFRGFDSDGDALSGYTGDADVSMEEIYVRPKTPTTTGPRPASRADLVTRRRLPSLDGDSDTVSELPSLSIRTREFNKSTSGGPVVSPSSPPPSRALHQTGSSFMESVDHDVRERPKSPPGARRGATRKTARVPSSVNLASTPRAPLSMEEVASWKPRDMQPSSSPPRPMVDTSKTHKPSANRGSSGGLSSSTTLVPSASARTPSSAASHGSQVLTASPTEDRISLRQPFHQHYLSGSGSSTSPLHFRHPSSSQQNSSTNQHSQHPSADTLVSHHLKNFSSASNASTLAGGYHHAAGSSSGGHHAIATAMAAMHAEQELQRQRQQLFLMQKRGSGSGSSSGVAEFDPSVEFPPVTPVDLKAMDFETLLATAERDHLQGWEDLKQQKKNLPSVLNRASVAPTPAPASAPAAKSASPSGKSSRANLQPLKIITHHSPPGPGPSNTTAVKQGGGGGAHPSRSAVAFDLSPSDDGTGSGMGGTTGTGTGSDRSGHLRSKRVMKKKMSVIRLAGNGNIQGRREDDGVIRVSMSSTNFARQQNQQQQQQQQQASPSNHSSNQSSPGSFTSSGRYQQHQDWRQ